MKAGVAQRISDAFGHVMIVGAGEPRRGPNFRELRRRQPGARLISIVKLKRA